MINPFRKARDVVKRASRRVTERFGRKAKPQVTAPPPVKPPEPRITRPAEPSLEDLVKSVRATGIGEGTDRFPGSHAPDRITDLVEALGRRNARTLIAEQLESTNAYKRGSIQPGNERWHNRIRRIEELQLRQGELAPFESFDPFFYYHARKD